MRILLLAPQPFYVHRGTPIAVRALLEGLAELGHSIDLLTYHQGEDVQIANVQIHRIKRPCLVNRVPIGPSWQKLLCDMAMWRQARDMVKAQRYDLLHAVEESAFMARVLHKRFALPYIYDMDSLMSLQITDKSKLLWPVAKLFERLERRAIAQSVGVLAVCPALVDVAMRYQPAGNVALLPDLPMSGEGDKKATEQLADAPGVKLMYVGNLEAYQGVELMVDAFVAVAEQGCDATLLIVGGTEQAIDRYRQKYSAMCQSGRVRLVGPRSVEELGQVLSCADVLLSPRIKGNNTPMKIYSYLESGKALLATRLATHTQVLNDEIACLVEPTVEAMAQGMGRLIASEELRSRLGLAGQSHVRQHYGPEAFRQRLEQFYHKAEQIISKAG